MRLFILLFLMCYTSTIPAQFSSEKIISTQADGTYTAYAAGLDGDGQIIDNGKITKQ